jgi:LacI family transcriptional regulator
MVRIQDIAKAANVSPATVSRCLNKDPSLSISTQTGKKIYDIALAMGYGKLKAMEKSEEFLVIHKEDHFHDHVDNGYYFAIRSGIEEVIAKNGDICRFVSIAKLETEEKVYTGILVIGNYRPQDIEHIKNTVHNENIVFVGKLNFYPECFDTVTYNVGLCVYLALNAIREKGFTQFLFFDGKDHYQIPQDYLKITHVKNYLSIYQELSLVEYIECDGFGFDAGYRSMKEYREKHGSLLPKAIFAATDPIGIGIIKALTEERVVVGQDVHIISMNGSNACTLISPALTSVDYHSREMGKEAAILVKENARKEERIPKCVSFAPRINEGGSL